MEASLRRFAHYDFWEEAVRPVDPSRFARRYPRLRHAEHAVVEIASRVASGERIDALDGIRGTVVVRREAAVYGAVDHPVVRRSAGFETEIQ